MRVTSVLVALAVQLVAGYEGGTPFGAIGVPHSDPAVPGATTTYYGNGRFIGFPSHVHTGIVPAAAGLFTYQLPTTSPAVLQEAAPAVIPAAAPTAIPVVTTGLPAVVAGRKQVNVPAAAPAVFAYQLPTAAPAVLQEAVARKQVPVAAAPAFKTSTYQVRRPAIHKQYYDVEERVVIRPAGAAVVELAESGTLLGPSAPVSAPQPQQTEPELQNNDDSISVEAAPLNGVSDDAGRDGND